MRYFHGVTQSTYQRDIYFNRYRAAHQIYGVFYRIFLSHTFGAVQVGLYQLIFPHLCSWLFRNLCRNPDDSLPQCCQPSCSGQKKKPASFSIPDFSSRCPSPAVLQFFCKNSRHFWLALYFGDRRCEHLLILLSYVFPFSAIHSCITGYCLGLKDTKIPSSSQLLEQTVRIFSVLVICQFLNHTEGSSGIWIAVLGLIFR